MTGFIACVNNDDGKDDSSANNTISWESVFIPDDLSSKTLAGIYTGPYSDSSEAQGFKESGTYAFCLYEDGTFAETYKGTYTNTKTGTTTKVEKGVWKGTYTKVDGDYTNGKFTIKITLQWDPENNDWGYLNRPGTLNLLISDGAFKFEGISYGKKDTSSGNSSSGGSTTVTPVAQTVTVPNDVFFPDDFKDRTISALWKASNSGYNYGLFFFSDNTWLETWIDTDTGNKFYAYKGTWQKVTGDFTSGSVSIIKTHANNTVYSDRWRELSPAHYGTVTAANSKLTVVSESSSYSVTSAPASVPYSLVGVASGGGGSGSGGSGSGGGNETSSNWQKYLNHSMYSDFKTKSLRAWYESDNTVNTEGTGYAVTHALLFFTDKTFTYSTFDGTATNYDIRPMFKGVYTGDPTKDGTITVTSRSSTLDYTTWYDSSYGSTDYTITNGKIEFNLEYLYRQTYTGGSSGGSSGSGGGSSTSGVTLPSEFQSKTVSAVFYYTEYSSYLNGDETTYLYFFSDNTFITMWSFGNESEPASKGVYSMTGSWTNGSISVTNQYEYDSDSGWVVWDSSEDGSPYATGSLSSSALTVTYEGKSGTFPRLQ